MAKHLVPYGCILLITTALALSPPSTAVDPSEVGSAARYDSPYTPNACRYDEERLPSGGLFGAIDQVLWNKGSQCGTIYQVRCISEAGACLYGTSINITIVDLLQKTVSEPSNYDVLFALSSKAYGLIADPAKDSIKIQFQRL
ncbi:hypothetical protein SLEP1_g27088 [Rubroshorea leprosula]|uniref:Expansin-like EG45 domain-containing protein n=1 Tax=Rubroshorea leprosula TaxID=152421 RepID=A0AAV5JPC7_9ROSI|nr:hypothetical protein SLEP1_g27088 [Rubroshorea leprosula]